MAAALVAAFRKGYGAFTLDAQLSVPTEGAPILVLFGPSGAGKSTLLRCLAGLESPDQGSIRFGEEVWFSDAGSLSPQARRVGCLFQEYALFPHLTVEGNIGYGARGPDRPQRVAALVSQLKLEGLERKHPAALSGGQRQRVGLARALAISPRLLLLDEPLSALDAPLREPLRHELRQTLKRAALPAIVVTHDRGEALALGDLLAVVADGRVLQVGAVDDVFSRPADLVVARTVGVETVVPGRVVAAEDGLLTVEVGTARLRAVDPGGLAGPVFVCVRAEEVILERGPGLQKSARNQIRGRVTSIRPEGALVRIGLECGFSLSALITRPAAAELALREGEEVGAIVKATAVHLVARD
jgi:molybdate transport system ATP-binding protein